LIHNDLTNLFSDGFAEYSLRAIGVATGSENSGEMNKTVKNLERIAFSQTKSTETKVDAIKDLLNSKKNKTPNQANLRKTTETLRGLFRHFPRTIPIVMEDIAHENDHGDEEFAARIAVAMNADALVAISKKGMLFTTDPDKRRGIPFYCYDTARGTPFSENRRGVLAKKLNAAAFVNENNKHIPMLLAANDRPFAITNMFSEDSIAEICDGGSLFNFTLFVNSRNADLPIEARYISGKVVIDTNAVRALVDEKRSLLLAGVVEIDGDFDERSVVLIVDGDGVEIGKGVVNYSSAEMRDGMDSGAEIVSREKMRL